MRSLAAPPLNLMFNEICAVRYKFTLNTDLAKVGAYYDYAVPLLRSHALRRAYTAHLRSPHSPHIYRANNRVWVAVAAF